MLSLETTGLWLPSKSPKSIDLLKAIVGFPADGFLLSELGVKLGVDPATLRGSWSGLTKVVRRVTDDDDAALFWWEAEAGGDDSIGYLSPEAYRAIRRAFRMPVDF